MARTMHHKERQLPAEETKMLLGRGKEGILAVNGDEGYPYAVPVNYICSEKSWKKSSAAWRRAIFPADFRRWRSCFLPSVS